MDKIANSSVLDKLGKLGLSGSRLDDTVKNNRLTNTLVDIVNVANNFINNDLTSYGNLLYKLGSMKQKNISEANRDIIIEYIVTSKIDTEERLTCATKHVESFRKEEDAIIDREELDNICGVGIIVTKEEIDEKIKKLVVENGYDGWKEWSKVLKEVRSSLKWADGQMIKEQTDYYFESYFGPRVKVNVKKVKKVKKKNPPSVSTIEKRKDFEFDDPAKNYQNRQDLLDKHLEATNGKVITRFPPEPNGFLHIGHAKAMYINFSYAKRKNGLCYLRFDDTNPTKEKDEYIDAILEDVRWLGHDWYKVTYSSDYFDKLYRLAKELIKKDKAYICQLSQEQMQDDRKNGVDSPYRNRPIEESLDLFEKMKDRIFPENSITLRMKGDMQSNNPNMRDLVAYRIIYRDHPRTGNKWCIYPSYDYTHCIVDSLENITHSLCSMEFQMRNETYRWLLDALDLYRPPQIEYSRLNITNTILSKRKLVKLIESNHINGWDDPRILTIRGLKRRGYTPEAINDFCQRIGLSLGQSSNAIVQYELLEECIRQDLENRAPRVMAVLDPLKVTIVNWNSEDILVDFRDFPNLGEHSPTHKIKFGKTVYIDRTDFRLVDSKKYYRLAPNKIVRLRYGYPIKCIDYKLDDTGKVVEIFAEYIPDYEANYKERIKGTINWVKESISIEIRSYEHIFPKNISNDPEWLDKINIDSVKIYRAYVDPIVESAKPYDKFQFERIGYFSVDPSDKVGKADSNSDKKVFNMVVSLKESKGKKLIG